MCVCVYIHTHICTHNYICLYFFFLVRISLLGLLCLSFKQQANMQGAPANTVGTFWKSQLGQRWPCCPLRVGRAMLASQAPVSSGFPIFPWDLKEA